jgi:hypothetical protein
MLIGLRLRRIPRQAIEKSDNAGCLAESSDFDSSPDNRTLLAPVEVYWQPSIRKPQTVSASCSEGPEVSRTEFFQMGEEADD